jgi:glutamate-1-semialdehyde 2,1-aminomutase
VASYAPRFGKPFHHMPERGIYMAPSQFEAGFVSGAHSEADLAKTVVATKGFFA